MIHDRSQNPLVVGDAETDDARNVDEQLDEIMKQRDAASERQPIVNHSNNAHVEPRKASDPPN
jgi:hypothetical protein